LTASQTLIFALGFCVIPSLTSFVQDKTSIVVLFDLNNLVSAIAFLQAVAIANTQFQLQLPSAMKGRVTKHCALA